jgi:hypothetical protein
MPGLRRKNEKIGNHEKSIKFDELKEFESCIFVKVVQM